MTKRNKKSEVEKLNHPSDVATRQFIKDFSLFIKQC